MWFYWLHYRICNCGDVFRCWYLDVISVILSILLIFLKVFFKNITSFLVIGLVYSLWLYWFQYRFDYYWALFKITLQWWISKLLNIISIAWSILGLLKYCRFFLFIMYGAKLESIYSYFISNVSITFCSRKFII